MSFLTFDGLLFLFLHFRKLFLIEMKFHYGDVGSVLVKTHFREVSEKHSSGHFFVSFVSYFLNSFESFVEIFSELDVVGFEFESCDEVDFGAFKVAQVIRSCASATNRFDVNRVDFASFVCIFKSFRVCFEFDISLSSIGQHNFLELRFISN